MKQKIKIKTGQDIQDDLFKKMSADEKIRLTFALNRFLLKIAEDSIREQYPGADEIFVKEKLLEKIEIKNNV